MANTTPTKLNPTRVLYLMILLIFAPQKFIGEEEKDNEYRNTLPKEYNKTPRAIILRLALIYSLSAVILSGLVGYLIGLIAVVLYPSPSPTTIIVIQIIGALLLLWGTLFIRGWEIETHGGITFTERANQWIYRSLYCIGTTLVVLSLVWS